MKVFSSQGKFNVFIIFLILAISSSLVGKLTSTYDKDILFKLVLTDLPKDKVVYDKSHDSVMLKVRGYGFNLAKYYFETPSLNISVKKLKESNNTFLWNQKDNFNDTKLSFDSSIELLNISEDSLLFYYDQYISQNKKCRCICMNIYIHFVRKGKILYTRLRGMYIFEILTYFLSYCLHFYIFTRKEKKCST